MKRWLLLGYFNIFEWHYLLNTSQFTGGIVFNNQLSSKGPYVDISSFLVDSSTLINGTVAMLSDWDLETKILTSNDPKPFFLFDFGEILNLRAVIVIGTRRDKDFTVRLGWEETLTKTDDLYIRNPHYYRFGVLIFYE